MKKKMKSGSSWANNFGNTWILIFTTVFPLAIGITIITDTYAYNVIYAYFIIGCGTFPAMALFLLERPYPFTGDMVFSRNVNTLSEEDRKILTFWKTSKRIRNIVFKTECGLLILVFFMLLITIFLKPLYTMFDIQAFAIACGLGILYSMFSIFIFMFTLARFLLNNIDEIKKIDIEPWPIDKPYAPGPSWLKYRKEGQEKSSIFTELLNTDPNTPFSWSDFGALILGFAGFVLLWSGFETIFKSFKGVGVVMIISGFVLFQIALKLWKIKHRK